MGVADVEFFNQLHLGNLNTEGLDVLIGLNVVRRVTGTGRGAGTGAVAGANGDDIFLVVVGRVDEIEDEVTAFDVVEAVLVEVIGSR